ncbi:MAG: DUF2635 domain-containing protein [Sneathiella sp.]
MAIKIKPNPDKLVDGKPVVLTDPITLEDIPTQGKNVPNTLHWQRCLRSKDAVYVEPTEQSGKHLSLTDAIKVCFDASDDTHLTNAGKPDCKVLSKLTGENISAATRDKAVAAMEGTH